MIGDKDCAREATRLIVDRDRRYALFPAELFDEFPWNMLLHLFVALESNRVMSEATLCELSKGGRVIGRRWIDHLIKNALVEEREDGDDVILTPDAIERMRRYLRPLEG